MKLIINADDFALTNKVTEGIIKSIKLGVVRDTTIMVNTDSFNESVRLSKENGILKMGIHLNLTCGKPLLKREEVKTICDESGNFFRKPKLIPKDINLLEVEKEYRAQIKRFKESGLKLNHIDSHHHTYIFNDSLLDIVIKLALEEGVPIRCPLNEKLDYIRKKGVKTPDYFEKSFYGDSLDGGHLIKRIEELKEKYDVVEFMVHPAIVDEKLKEISSYSDPREKELEILTSKEVKNYIDNNNIELCSFDILKED
ncbi:MAG: chitin disaccharide deacetylase [Clostridium chrysemydis]|uniref:chitin disaccharide deacetylase n=1 Tax=Clostridium chrysemydis TaxID=2665504 RepID=UPI003F385D99